MRRKGQILTVVAMALLAGLVLAACAPAAKEEGAKKRTQIVAGSMGGSGYTWAAALTKVFNKYYPEIEWSSRSGGTTENVTLIEKKEIELGEFILNDVYVAKEGKLDAVRNYVGRIVLPLFSTWYLLVVPPDKAWNNILDIPKGTSWAVGKSGSGTVWINRYILEALGLKEADYKWQFLGGGDSARAWRDGTIDVNAINIGVPAPPLIDMATAKRGWKVLEFTQEQQKRLVEYQPEAGFLPGTIKAGQTEGLTKDIRSMYQPYYLFAHADFSEDMAYKMAKAFHENFNEMVQMYKAAEESTPEYAIGAQERGVFKLHPGTAKYYKEIGKLK